MTLCCAHRGASGHAPENTMAALARAIEMRAEMAEIDVQQTADDRLAVFHDTDLDRTSDGDGPLWRRTMAELQPSPFRGSRLRPRSPSDAGGRSRARPLAARTQ